MSLVAVVSIASTATVARRREGAEAEWGQLSTQFVEFFDQGKYDEADSVVRDALNLASIYVSQVDQTKSASAERPTIIVASVLETMAGVYQDARKFAEAEPLLVRSQEVYEKAFGPDHLYVASILNRLAIGYVKEGKYSEAEPIYNRMLAIYEKQPYPHYSEVARALYDLAGLYRVQRKLAEAEPLYRRALAIKDYVSGFNNPTTGQTLNDFGMLLYDRGSYQEAEKILLRAVVCFEATGSPQDQSLRSAYANLATVYEKLGDTDKQRSYVVRANRIPVRPN